MNAHIVFGFFALYVAAISLYLVLAGRQEAVLALLRRFWGRTRGYSLYFVANVALPLLICVLCLGWGVRHYDARTAFHSFTRPLHLNVEKYREFRLMLQEARVVDSLGVLYGA
jgi:hypothetical protein